MKSLVNLKLVVCVFVLGSCSIAKAEDSSGSDWAWKLEKRIWTLDELEELRGIGVAIWRMPDPDDDYLLSDRAFRSPGSNLTGQELSWLLGLPSGSSYYDDVSLIPYFW